MSTEDIDFMMGYVQHEQDKKEQELNLCYGYPIINEINEADVLTRNNKNPRDLNEKTEISEDGLYVSDSPFIYSDIKPFELNNMKILEYKPKHKFSGKLVEIVIREVNVNTLNQSDAIQITSVYLLFKKTIICKAHSPFNRKLHKLLIRNSECNNLSIQIHVKGGQSSVVPLLLPKHNVENSKVQIDFAIGDNSGRIHDGTVLCTVTLKNYGSDEPESCTTQFYKLSNDPNDPQNHLSLLRPPKNIHKKEVKYFLLQDPVLTFDVDSEVTPKRVQVEKTKPPDIVITEQPTFSLFDTFFRNLFQSKRPLESSAAARRQHPIGKTILTVNILRGIELPIREESAQVQSFVEVEWGNIVHTTPVTDGPAPVWHHTMRLELPRQNDENSIKFRLYDQHPVWGKQWLGETRIPLEYHKNYQELERWITLSPLYSPVLLCGYVQASPGHSATRIYVLIRLEHSGTPKSIESTTILKGIQRCLSTPYKINGLENPKDVARLAMLLPSLPTHYGPVTPRQALSMKKVDYYGRAALLATLLQGFDLKTYVLLGSSQISKWTAFVLSISENGIYTLWDPDTGTHYSLDDSLCPLLKVSRLINHFGVSITTPMTNLLQIVN